MNRISDKLIQLIRHNNFADPFSEDFSLELIETQFIENLTEEEVDFFKFLITCNELWF
jgi:hypothetical protein